MGVGVGGTKGHQGRGHLSNHLKSSRTSQTHIPGRRGRFRVGSRYEVWGEEMIRRRSGRREPWRGPAEESGLTCW